MKRICTLFTVIFVSTFLGCKDFSCQDIFTLGSVRRVRDDNIERLKKKAEEYDKVAWEKIESAEKAGDLYQKLGEKYLQRKLWDLSITSLEKALGYGRETPIVHYSLAVAYANRGKEMKDNANIDKAEHHYRRALEINPDYDQAAHGLGIILFYVKHDRDGGLKVMKRVVRRNRNYYNARFTLARFYYELKKPEKSLAIYEELHSDLRGLPDSSAVKTFRENCERNIERLMMELSTKR